MMIATVEGLPWWSLNDTDDEAARDTWRMLTPHAADYLSTTPAGGDTVTTRPGDDVSPAHTPSDAVTGPGDAPVTAVTPGRAVTAVTTPSPPPVTPGEPA